MGEEGVNATGLPVPGDQAPDQAGVQHDRLGLAQVSELLCHDQQVSQRKYDKRSDSQPVIGQAERVAISTPADGRRQYA